MASLQVKSKLRDYQEICVGDYVRHIDEGINKPLLYASPTGTGKSLVALSMLAFDELALLTTPRLEIVAGMLNKGGINTDSWNVDRLAEEALKYRITTPIRLRNMLAKGTLPFRPHRIIHDECHHANADTYQEIHGYLGDVQRVGLTATPFRGTPQGTAEFYKQWGDEISWMISIARAAENNYIAVPQCSVWPLVDDDLIATSNGEFQIESAGAAAIDAVEECARRMAVEVGSYGDSHWDTPTIFAMPNTVSVHAMVRALLAQGLPAVAITQDTPRAERILHFADCVASRVALVQIDVISEGVDLPIGRVVDLRVTLSPVKWMQQIGRLRYGGLAQYLCCNRNLERHGYLYDGVIPAGRIKEAQTAFGKMSKRAGMLRAVGVETIGRFSGAELPLADGTTGTLYHLYALNNAHKVEYAVILHPRFTTPLYASREIQRIEGQTVYAGAPPWKRIDSIPDLRGFAATPQKAISDKQRAWWQRSAGHFGLAAAGSVNQRNFTALPILKDCGMPREWRG